MTCKTCSRCKLEKPLEQFGIRLDRPDGHKYTCKQCESERQMDRYAKDPEKHKARNRDLGIVPKSRFSRFKKRCKLTGKEFDLTFEQWSTLVLDKPCHYCSGPLETKGCGLDRKNNSLGYIVSNVVSCCKECNRLKGPHISYEEMVAIANLLKTIRNSISIPKSVVRIVKPEISTNQVCHQKIRKDQTETEDRLAGYRFDLNAKDFMLAQEKMTKEHIAFIERYEWLGKIGWAVKWCFTARHDGKLAGVVLMSEPTMATKYKQYEALIQRGAASSWAPKNLNSRLVMFSCNWMVQHTEKRLFTCYSDPAAGEIGTIYQACNFMYLGRGWGVKSGVMLPSGKIVSKRDFTKTSAMKRWAKELGIQWQKEWCKPNGYQNVKAYPPEIKTRLLNKAAEEIKKYPTAQQESKGKYALILGKDKREDKALKKLIIFDTFPYPKREK